MRKEALKVFEKDLPRGRFCVYESQPEIDLLRVKQTHSSIVLPEDDCYGMLADGMVGDSHSLMAILTADCLPIVLLGENEHALVHAGWRGLQNQILINPLIQKIKPFYAFIGPHISQDHYEVSPDFKNNFPDEQLFKEIENKIFFSLSLAAKYQLQRFYPGITIEESFQCTFADEKFHSYRRNKTTQRNWNIYSP